MSTPGLPARPRPGDDNAWPENESYAESSHVEETPGGIDETPLNGATQKPDRFTRLPPIPATSAEASPVKSDDAIFPSPPLHSSRPAPSAPIAIRTLPPVPPREMPSGSYGDGSPSSLSSGLSPAVPQPFSRSASSSSVAVPSSSASAAPPKPLPARTTRHISPLNMSASSDAPSDTDSVPGSAKSLSTSPGTQFAHRPLPSVPPTPSLDGSLSAPRPLPPTPSSEVLGPRSATPVATPTVSQKPAPRGLPTPSSAAPKTPVVASPSMPAPAAASSSSSSLPVDESPVGDSPVLVSPPDTATPQDDTADATPLPPPTPVDPDAWRDKRVNIVNEIYETEQAYFKDLELLESAYMRPTRESGLLSKHEEHVLFGELDNLLNLSSDLMQTLYPVILLPVEEQRVGACFLQHAERLAKTYTDYCVQQDNVGNLLIALSDRDDVVDFFDQCQAQIQGRTTAWDLGSMLIKPVQRILKYPLLLKDLLFKGTNDEHAERAELTDALGKMVLAAEGINKSRRTKDLVLKSHAKTNTQEKAQKLLSGEVSSKAVSRVAQRMAQVVGARAQTVDATFVELAASFERRRTGLNQIVSTLNQMLASMKSLYEQQQDLLGGFEDFMLLTAATPSVASVINMKQVTGSIQHVILPQLQQEMQRTTFAWLAWLQQGFASAADVISKRNRKLLDFDRCEMVRKKGGEPEKLLQVGADAYTALNSKLIEELPAMLNCANDIVDASLVQTSALLANFFSSIREQLTQTLHGSYPNAVLDGDLVDMFLERFLAGGRALVDLSLLSERSKEIITLSEPEQADTAGNKFFTLKGMFSSAPSHADGSMTLSRRMQQRNSAASSVRSGASVTSFSSTHAGSVESFEAAAPQLPTPRGIASSEDLICLDSPAPVASQEQLQQQQQPQEQQQDQQPQEQQEQYQDQEFQEEPTRVRALYAYKAESENEVSMEEGATLDVVSFEEGQESTEWVQVRDADGKIGWVPSNYVEYC